MLVADLETTGVFVENFFVLFLGQQLTPDQGLFINEVSRSHAAMHHIR
jgi:hypothetical protein